MTLTTSYLAAIITVPIVSLITYSIYRVYFDGLSGYPGPKLWALSPIPSGWTQIRGQIPYKLAEFHDQYGPVVRISPTSLSYIAPEAWIDIYGKTRPQLLKDPNAGPPPPSGVKGLAFTDFDDAHARMRRNLSHGFTEKALKEQEPILKGYVDLLIQKLREHSAEGPVDISAWLQYYTVDVVGDLTFGESFHCLEKSTMHSWMQNIFFFLKAFVMVGVVTRILPFMNIIFWLAKQTKVFGEKEALHRGFTNERLAKRLEMTDARTDFMTYAQKHLGTPSGMSLIELQETCSALMIGGSETTASLLSGVIYYLLKNPAKLEKLNQEIRSAFRTEDDIDIVSTKRLTYQAAVVEESMRIFSPLPQQIQRVTSPEGNMIAGRFVPGGTKVGVTHWPAYHSSLNFKDPYDFVPERWLRDEMYKDDRRDVLKPFSYGPRNCIGINLAYAEINLVLARLLWTFDMELRPECNDWVRGMPVWAVYQRPPLWINLLPVVRD